VSPIREAAYWNCIDPTKVKKFTKARKGVRWMGPGCGIRSCSENRATDQLSAAQWLYQVITIDVNEGFEIPDLAPATRDVLEIFRGLNHSCRRTLDKPCKSR
jgi:hypothetical protein